MQALAEQHCSVYTMLVVLDVNYNSSTFMKSFKIE